MTYQNPKKVDFFEAAVRMADRAASVKSDDYIVNGIPYCVKCRTPKRIRQEYAGNVYIVPVMCECAKADKEREAVKQLIEKREEMRKTALPNEKYRVMTLESSDISLPIAENYISNWNFMLRNNIGLYLWGNTGSGKTYMAAAIANKLVDTGIKVYMDSVTQYTNKLGDVYGGGRDEIIYRIKSCDLLIIDDFGVERSSEFSQQQIYDLLELRSETGKPMIVTSNIPIPNLQSESDQRKCRIYSRLGALHSEKVVGKDRRFTESKNREKSLHDLLTRKTEKSGYLGSNEKEKEQ